MSRKVAGWLAALTTCVAVQSAEATEGAASYYFPGAFGSFLVAVPPEPGFSVASQTLIFGDNAQKSVLNRGQTFGINAFAVYEYLAQPARSKPRAAPPSSPSPSRPRTSSARCCCARLRS